MSLVNQVEPDVGTEVPAGMLSAVGIEPQQERVYVALVDCPGMTALALSRTVGLRRDDADQALEDLLAKGLITTEAGPQQRYRAVAPDVAIEALIAQQQQELARARLAASGLRERARIVAAERDDGLGDVETVVGGLAASQRLWQLQVAAEREVLSAGLPSITRPLVAGQGSIELTCLRRGVAHWALYDRDVLAQPGNLDGIREYVAAGGQARVAELPVRLVVVDGKTAVLPVYSGGELTGATVVRSESVVAALTAMCEFVWLQAAPLTFTADGSVDVADNGGGADLVDLIPMLMAGCKDDAIARQVGVSTRTLDRRIRALMDGLGAVTRFQAGWFAARRHPDALDGGRATCHVSASHAPCG